MRRAEIQRPWSRDLPGGGFVAIDVHSEHSWFHGSSYHGELIVERRAEAREGGGHDAPVIARAEGDTVEAVIQQLVPMGASNTAIGSGLLQWEKSRV
jgi:hypothetical protein